MDVEFFKQPNPQPDQDRRAEPELEWTSGGKRRHQTEACEDERRYQHEQRLAARRGTDREEFSTGHATSRVSTMSPGALPLSTVATGSSPRPRGHERKS